VRELRPSVPEALSELVMRCLEKEPENRWQRAEEMLPHLEGASVSGRDPAAEPGPSGNRPGPAHRRMVSVAGWKRVAPWATLTLVVALALTLNQRNWWNAPEPAYPRTAIAVLPFRAHDAGGDYGFVPSALQDELRTHLSGLKDLKVVGRRSVLAYAGPEMPLDRIAQDLGVGSVIEASVWILEDRLKIAVELLDAVSGRQLWANVYERTLDDVFAVQAEIATEIVREVGLELTRAESKAMAAPSTEDPEAYELYLQAEQYRRRPGRLQENLLDAQQLYERALELDPAFALAHARLAEVHAFHINIGWDRTPARRDRMLEAAETALSLAPDLAQAHIAMGLVHYYGRMDYAAALEEFELALQRRPNDAEVWKWIGYARRRMADWEGAMAAFEETRELDPWHFDLFSDLGGMTFWITHRYAEAIDAFHRAWEIAPDAHSAAVDKGWMFVFWRGQADTLRAVLESLPLQEEIGLHLGTVAGERARLLLYERRGDSLLSLLARGRERVLNNQAEYLPASLYAAWANQLRHDGEAARTAFRSSLTLLDSVVAEMPDHWPAHAARGLTLAGLGRSEEALAEARWLEETPVYRKNATVGLLAREYRVYILAQTGEAERALEEIEDLIQGPSLYVTPQTLAADPRFDPIREHPGFRALMESHEQAGIR
jgi:TolB-like protein